MLDSDTPEQPVDVPLHPGGDAPESEHNTPINTYGVKYQVVNF